MLKYMKYLSVKMHDYITLILQTWIARKHNITNEENFH